MTAPDFAGVLAAHQIVYENDGGDYGGRSWLECSCDHDNVLSPTEYATEAAHRAHVAAALHAEARAYIGLEVRNARDRALVAQGRELERQRVLHALLHDIPVTHDGYASIEELEAAINATPPGTCHAHGER